MTEQQSNNTSRRGAHLDPYKFQPGQSGNPNGRPKGVISLKEKLRQQLNEVVAADGMTAGDALVRTTLQAALKGDKAARELVWAYVDGKPTQSVDLNATITEVAILDDIPNTD